MEIVSGVHWIEGIIGHCYLVVDDEITLIDTGLPRNMKKIIRYITEKLHRNPSDINTICLTHADVDHIGNAEKLRTLTGAKIAAHPEDAEIIAGRTPRLMPKGTMNALFKLVRPVMATRPFEVDIIVNEGDDIAGLKVIHMPGHTPGSIALYDAQRKVMFVGDALGCEDGMARGPSEMMTMDIARAYASIKKLASYDFSVMLSGHSKPLLPDASMKVQEFITTRNKEE
jgi:glyoxylase-like metal-dependent hydrolase (beta-lactamase superfamily II)